jgi:hypothetical protein
MTPAFHIAPVTALHPDMRALQSEAAAEGFRFVDKLIEDWLSATNRFDRPGELCLDDRIAKVPNCDMPPGWREAQKERPPRDVISEIPSGVVQTRNRWVLPIISFP